MALTKAKASNILLTTPAASSNDTTPATTEYVTTAIANLIDNAPANLNTLNELAAAMADNASFFSTVLPLSGGTMTGTLTTPTLITGAYGAGGSAGDGFRLNSTDLYGQVDASDKIRINVAGDSFFNGGNVAIGKLVPTVALDVVGQLNVLHGASAMRFEEWNNNATIWLDGSNGDFAGGDYWNFTAHGTTHIGLGYAAGTNFALNSSGNVGIGTSTIHADLHLGTASPHIDLGPHTGNRGKVGFDSNNVYIGSSSGTGQIHFKNNIGSTDAPHSSGDTKMVITDSAIGIDNTNPVSKLHLHGTSGQTNYNSHTNVDEYLATFQTSYNGAGAQNLHIVNHNGNWNDGTSGSDSAYGFMWGYENNIRAGIHYDHRGSEKFDFYSSYAPFRFRVPNSVSGNLSPIGTESTMRSALTVAIGGLVGVGTDAPRRHLHVHNPTAATTNIMITNSATGESNDSQGLQLGVSSNGTAYIDNKEATNLQIISNGSIKQNILAASQSNCHVDINGGVSVGIGNTSAAGDTGMNVKGWYNATAHSSNSYLHLNTSLWGGGSPHGNSMYIMGGWKVMAHQYATNNSYGQCTVFFHNWSGSVASGFSQTYGPGPWTGWMHVYVNSSGYVTIRLLAGTYRAYWLDYYQAPHYPARNTYVTAATFSNSTTL